MHTRRLLPDSLLNMESAALPAVLNRDSEGIPRRLSERSIDPAHRGHGEGSNQTQSDGKGGPMKFVRVDLSAKPVVDDEAMEKTFDF